MIINNYNDRFNQIIQRGHTYNTISPKTTNPSLISSNKTQSNFAKSKFFL